MTISKLFTDFKQLNTFRDQGALKVYNINYKQAVLHLIITKVIYVGVFFVRPFIFTDFKWWQTVLGFAIMHITASAIMGTVFQMAHVVEGVEQPQPDSEGIIHNHSAVHQLMTTSDFAHKRSLISWYIGVGSAISAA